MNHTILSIKYAFLKSFVIVFFSIEIKLQGKLILSRILKGETKYFFGSIHFIDFKLITYLILEDFFLQNKSKC